MNGRWEFLQVAQRAGAPVARQTLVQRCEVDSSVLTFIAGVAHRQAELARGAANGGHKTAIALFAVVTLEVLAQCVFGFGFFV
jgi:hypothetical protein